MLLNRHLEVGVGTIDLALVDNPELYFKSAIAFKQALLSVI